MAKALEALIGDEFDNAIRRLMSSTGLAPAEIMEMGVAFLSGRYAVEEGVTETLGLIRDVYDGFSMLSRQNNSNTRH